MSQPLALATRRGSTDPSLLYRNPLKGSSPCFLSSMTQTETADELKRGQMEEQRALEDGDRHKKGHVSRRLVVQARLHEEMSRRTSLPAPGHPLVLVSFIEFSSPVLVAEASQDLRTGGGRLCRVLRRRNGSQWDLMISAGSRETRPRAACCSDCVCQAGYRRNMSGTAILGAGSVRYELKSPGRFLPMRTSHYDGRRDKGKRALLRAPVLRGPAGPDEFRAASMRPPASGDLRVFGVASALWHGWHSSDALPGELGQVLLALFAEAGVAAPTAPRCVPAKVTAYRVLGRFRPGSGHEKGSWSACQPWSEHAAKWGEATSGAGRRCCKLRRP